uniref:ADP-ribosylation factor-like 13A n=1 Tax=Scleropages formosus TaxID=113540 RepID=A0A8C9TTN4_SCLFO
MGLSAGDPHGLFHRKVTVLMVGLDNAGKTSILRSILKGTSCGIRSRFLNNLDFFVALSVPPKELGPTQGCVRTELRVDNFIVMVLDMGGSPEDRRCWRDYYGEAHGIIFVVDSSDEQRLPEAKELLVDMLKQIPFLFFAMSHTMGLDNIKSKPWHICASNALTGEGLQEWVHWL